MAIISDPGCSREIFIRKIFFSYKEISFISGEILAKPSMLKQRGCSIFGPFENMNADSVYHWTKSVSKINGAFFFNAWYIITLCFEFRGNKKN